MVVAVVAAAPAAAFVAGVVLAATVAPAAAAAAAGAARGASGAAGAAGGAGAGAGAGQGSVDELMCPVCSGGVIQEASGGGSGIGFLATRCRIRRMGALRGHRERCRGIRMCGDWLGGPGPEHPPVLSFQTGCLCEGAPKLGAQIKPDRGGGGGLL